MRFLVDMPLSPGLSEWLVQEGHEAVHALELGLARAPDTLILERARDDGGVGITADLDFPWLLASTHSDGPGRIRLRRLPV